MEIGIREAKNNLSKVIDAVLDGEEVFLTKRGERVVQLVPSRQPTALHRGRGLWKEMANLYPGWDSPAEDKKIEDLFETLRDAGR